MENFKSVEEEITSLLNSCASSTEDIKFGVNVNGRRWDAYTSSGIQRLNIASKTLIEIKRTLTPDCIFQVAHIKDDSQLPIDNCLIIYELENSFSSELAKHPDKKPQYVQCIKFQQIKEWGKGVKIISKKIKQESTITIYEKAQNDFKAGQNAFIIGAGISKSAGMPLWDELLTKLLQKATGRCSISEMRNIKEVCGQSPIIEGQYILSDIEEKKLTEYVSEVLNSYTPQKFETIDEIVEHIQKRRIDCILTYNYDDLLETRLDVLNAKYEGKDKVETYTIYGNNRTVGKYFPIYHLHGFCPINKAHYYFATPKITEVQYHQMYNQPYHWSNVTLLHTLNTKTCFFMGLSMTDPNLRRILDLYASENYENKKEDNYHNTEFRHYVFLRRDFFSRSASKNNNIDYWHKQEQLYDHWGIDVIWFDEYEDLPKLIKGLNK